VLFNPVWLDAIILICEFNKYPTFLSKTSIDEYNYVSTKFPSLGKNLDFQSLPITILPNEHMKNQRFKINDPSDSFIIETAINQKINLIISNDKKAFRKSAIKKLKLNLSLPKDFIKVEALRSSHITSVLSQRYRDLLSK
jgi:predicted nucleic acid-binding protein